MTLFPKWGYKKARKKILNALERTQAGDPVTSLDLSGRRLALLPPEIGELTSLSGLAFRTTN